MGVVDWLSACACSGGLSKAFALYTGVPRVQMVIALKLRAYAETRGARGSARLMKLLWSQLLNLVMQFVHLINHRQEIVFPSCASSGTSTNLLRMHGIGLSNRMLARRPFLGLHATAGKRTTKG